MRKARKRKFIEKDYYVNKVADTGICYIVYGCFKCHRKAIPKSSLCIYHTELFEENGVLEEFDKSFHIEIKKGPVKKGKTKSETPRKKNKPKRNGGGLRRKCGMGKTKIEMIEKHASKWRLGVCIMIVREVNRDIFCAEKIEPKDRERGICKFCQIHIKKYGVVFKNPLQ